MLKGIPVGLETIIVGLVVAVIGSVVSLLMSGQPLTWPVIVSGVIAALLNYFTSGQRLAQNPGQPNAPVGPAPSDGQSW